MTNRKVHDNNSSFINEPVVKGKIQDSCFSVRDSGLLPLPEFCIKSPAYFRLQKLIEEGLQPLDSKSIALRFLSPPRSRARSILKRDSLIDFDRKSFMREIVQFVSSSFEPIK